jgi:hypothetical protein
MLGPSTCNFTETSSTSTSTDSKGRTTTTTTNYCTHQRKLCVTCRQSSDSTTYIRVQTNDLPNHCYAVTTPSYQTLDFEVKWNTNPTTNVYNTATTASALTSIVCTSKRYTSDYIPSTVGYIDYQATLGPFVGVATSGGLLAEPLSGTGEDPYYPATGSASGTDVCSGHSDEQGNFHYHFMPGGTRIRFCPVPGSFRDSGSRTRFHLPGYPVPGSPVPGSCNPIPRYPVLLVKFQK